MDTQSFTQVFPELTHSLSSKSPAPLSLLNLPLNFPHLIRYCFHSSIDSLSTECDCEIDVEQAKVRSLALWEATNLSLLISFFVAQPFALIINLQGRLCLFICSTLVALQFEIKIFPHLHQTLRTTFSLVTACPLLLLFLSSLREKTLVIPIVFLLPLYNCFSECWLFLIPPPPSACFSPLYLG